MYTKTLNEIVATLRFLREEGYEGYLCLSADFPERVQKELDVFLLGVDTPVESFTGRIIGIVYRADDVEDKLVMSPEGMDFNALEIARAVRFQEKYYHTTIRALDGSTAEVER